MFFLTIRQVTSTFTVTDNHLFSTFMMGLLNTFFAWIGNSQAFALNSIAEDSFCLGKFDLCCFPSYDDWASPPLHTNKSLS